MRGGFCPQEAFSNVCRHWGCHNWGEGQRLGILWNMLHGQQAGQSPQLRGIQPPMSAVPTNPTLYCKPPLELAAGFPTLYKSYMRTRRGKGQTSPSHQPGAGSTSSLEVMTHHQPLVGLTPCREAGHSSQPRSKTPQLPVEGR